MWIGRATAGTRVGIWRGNSREEISHKQASSWDYLMERSTQGKSGDDMWWEENRISHDCNYPGPADWLGICPIDEGKALPKRDGLWEPTQVIAEAME